MKLNKQSPSFTIFLNFKIEQMKIQSLFVLSKEKLKSARTWRQYAIK